VPVLHALVALKAALLDEIASRHFGEFARLNLLDVGSGVGTKDPRCSKQTLHFGSDDGTLEHTIPIRNSQVSGKLYKSWNEASLPVLVDANVCRSNRPLFPAEPPEKQNEWRLSCNPLDVYGDFATARRCLIDSIQNDSRSWQSPAEAFELRGFDL